MDQNEGLRRELGIYTLLICQKRRKELTNCLEEFTPNERIVELWYLYAKVGEALVHGMSRVWRVPCMNDCGQRLIAVCV